MIFRQKLASEDVDSLFSARTVISPSSYLFPLPLAFIVGTPPDFL